MKSHILTLLLILVITNLSAQKIDVLTLGTFHFKFHNLDVIKLDQKNQIDVLKPKYQAEIEDIVEKLSAFKPTIIAIEVDPSGQRRVDSLYNEYLNGNYKLSREESEQIGFRLAKQFGLKTLHCVNSWGVAPESIDDVLNGEDSIASKKFYDFFYNHPDSSKMDYKDYVFQTKGILAELRQMNDEKYLKEDLGNYLMGVFKYETEEDEFFGVDFTTAWWFNRNLRIFRNIQRINSKADDKILVIFGMGHMNLLNPLFDISPEFNLLKVNDFLK